MWRIACTAIRLSLRPIGTRWIPEGGCSVIHGSLCVVWVCVCVGCWCGCGKPSQTRPAQPPSQAQPASPDHQPSQPSPPVKFSQPAQPPSPFPPFPFAQGGECFLRELLVRRNWQKKEGHPRQSGPDLKRCVLYAKQTGPFSRLLYTQMRQKTLKLD